MCDPLSASTTALTTALQLQRPVTDSMLQSSLLLPLHPLRKKVIIWLKVNNSQEMTPPPSLLPSSAGPLFKVRAFLGGNADWHCRWKEGMEWHFLWILFVQGFFWKTTVSLMCTWGTYVASNVVCLSHMLTNVLYIVAVTVGDWAQKTFWPVYNKNVTLLYSFLARCMTALLWMDSVLVHQSETVARWTHRGRSNTVLSQAISPFPPVLPRTHTHSQWLTHSITRLHFLKRN